MAAFFSLLSLLIAACTAQAASAALVQHVWTIEEWVVDYMRPTIDVEGYWPWQKSAARKSPFDMPESQRKNAYLVNGQYPGPTLEAFEGDQIEITIQNLMLSEAISIHWHGMDMGDTPFMDGSRGVTQAPILPGANFTYKFTANPGGSHYWHAHMDAVQGAKGLKGPIVIKKHEDPFAGMYDEDKVVVVSDEWRLPEICLKLEGAMPGNDVCADIRHAGFNGQCGNGTKQYPFPLITVEQGKCYRMRYIFMGSNAENFQIELAGHNMTLIAIDGQDVKPIQVTSFNMHLGERYDVVVCANQEPGNYLINATYDYACNLRKGDFIPPGFSAVPACSFYGFLNYKGWTETPTTPKGTGGGAHPKPVTGERFDLTLAKGWSLTEPLHPEETPDEPDVRYVINMGLLGPQYDSKNPGSQEPLDHGRWYMDLEGIYPRPWVNPTSPLYHTKGKCGVEDIPLINVPEKAVTVELVINNLSPTAHVLHMHGNKFQVINFADFESWCGLDKVSCFALTWWDPSTLLNKCPKHLRKVGDPKNPDMWAGGYWGCAYDNQTDPKTQNLKTPLSKDMLQVWQRSWAVVRFKATNPGMWYFHCHMEQHIPLGMQMVFNVLPSQQPPVPPEIPTMGPCPVVNSTSPSLANLQKENANLKKRLAEMSKKVGHKASA